MGPLNNYTIIEIAGIGPAPFATMLLADMGADVIRIENPNKRLARPKTDISLRGKRSVILDLKSQAGCKALLRLVASADAMVEGFRPGVAERLGFGPETCLALNPKLVYGRMTGWGQDGPLAPYAGHDINYIALTGALDGVRGKDNKPVPPLNLIGDMGGGMSLALGIVSAILEAKQSQQGQVIDAAITDSSALMMWMMHAMQDNQQWNANAPGKNILDGGAHFYNSYETKDGKFIALGCIESKFYQTLIEKAGLDTENFSVKEQMNADKWSNNQALLSKVFKEKTQTEWQALLEESDACATPVVSFLDAPKHPHNKARNTYISIDGQTQPAPAPRFNRTPSVVRHGTREHGADTHAVLKEFGFSESEIESLSK